MDGFGVVGWYDWNYFFCDLFDGLVELVGW